MEKYVGFITGLMVGVYLTCIWYEPIKKKWELRKVPFRWICPDCASKGNRFWCGSSSIPSLDAMVLEHKEEMHASQS